MIVTIKKFVVHLILHGINPTIQRVKKLFKHHFSYEKKILNNEFNRSHYVYCCFHAAKLASKLGHKKMSVIEFGCAGGKGLLALEKICSDISTITGVEIEIYGFDSGNGLPEPEGYKDLPYHWRGGFFKMDQTSLTPKLLKSKIIIGNVKDTIKKFIKEYNPAVIGCVFHDLDYYSSTQASFQLFEEDENYFLPRSFHYFDDIIGTEISLYSEWTGERLAVNQFNDKQNNKKFDNCNHLITQSNTFVWYHQIKILHMFKHKNYCDFVSEENQQLPI